MSRLGVSFPAHPLVDSDPSSRGRLGPHAARIAMTLCAAMVMGVVWAQSCRVEAEPNDAPAQATALGAARCLVGELDDQQDAFVWGVTSEDAGVPWVIELEGLPGRLTQLDLFDVEFASQSDDVLSAEGLWRLATTDGRLVASDPIWLPDGGLARGHLNGGGGLVKDRAS